MGDQNTGVARAKRESHEESRQQVHQPNSPKGQASRENWHMDIPEPGENPCAVKEFFLRGKRTHVHLGQRP